MEQPCYKCGQTVEQGIPFCPHCSAPQIRVVVEEPAVPEEVGDPNGILDVVTIPASQTVPVLALPMQWSQALRPCALAALIASLLMSLGLNPFVAMFSTGFLAVFFYRQRARGIAVKPARGSGIGALAGLLWFAMSSVVETLIVIFLHKGPELRNAMLEKLQQLSSQTSDPQVLAMFERFKSPGGLEFLMLSSLVFAFLASIVLSGLGGAAGGAILGRGGRS